MKMIKNNAILAVVVAAVSFWTINSQTAFAASTTVNVGLGGTRFSPTNVTILVNNSVVWIWNSTFHSSTSGTNGVPGDDNGVPSGSWDSGVIMSTPFSFTNTFTSTGVFSYYCRIHFGVGMTGQVFVVSAPLTIAITNPLNDAIFAAPASVAVQAAVTDISAPVTNVQFFADTTLLANEDTGPFSASANNLTAGNHTLSAIALDSNGLSATNTVNISVVTPIAITLTSAEMPSNANFQFTYSANVGLSYVVDRATDLVLGNWVPIATNVAASNPTNYVDTNATNNPAFYRVGLLPNP